MPPVPSSGKAWDKRADPPVAHGAPGYLITSSGRVVNISTGLYVSGSQPGTVPVTPSTAPRPLTQPATVAKATPWVKLTPDEASAGFDLPPDVSRSFQTFTDALGTHLPRSMNRIQAIGRAMHEAVR